MASREQNYSQENEQEATLCHFPSTYMSIGSHLGEGVVIPNSIFISLKMHNFSKNNRVRPGGMVRANNS
jgi:hypothetical protein